MSPPISQNVKTTCNADKPKEFLFIFRFLCILFFVFVTIENGKIILMMRLGKFTLKKLGHLMGTKQQLINISDGKICEFIYDQFMWHLMENYYNDFRFWGIFNEKQASMDINQNFRCVGVKWQVIWMMSKRYFNDFKNCCDGH